MSASAPSITPDGPTAGQSSEPRSAAQSPPAGRPQGAGPAGPDRAVGAHERRTPEIDPDLEQAIEDMAHWLRMMLSPDDPAAVIYHLHSDTPPMEPDIIELGDRVADELLSNYVYRSEDGLAVHLEILIERAEREARCHEKIAMACIETALQEQGADPTPDEDEPAGDGQFEIDTGMGTMLCGYCGQTASWAQAVLGYWRLTGYHMLGVRLTDGELVVLAEAETLDGRIIPLPHPCRRIPADLRERYAEGVAHVTQVPIAIGVTR